eukprot:2303507-Rhodomonas_salina.3
MTRSCVCPEPLDAAFVSDCNRFYAAQKSVGGRGITESVCEPLARLFEELGRTHVDYLSISMDLSAAALYVVQSVDWSAVSIGQARSKST